MEYIKVNIDSSNDVMVDKIMLDSSGRVIFISAIGYKSNIDKMISQFTSKESLRITYKKEDNGYYNVCFTDPSKKVYSYVTKKMGNNDYAHAIIYKKTYIDSNDMVHSYIYKEKNGLNNDLEDSIYNIIDYYSPIPFLKEWTSSLINTLNNKGYNNYNECYLSSMHNRNNYQTIDNLEIYYFKINNNDLKNIISKKLEDKEINIEGSNEKSILLEHCGGLNDYLDIFGESLANKIQTNFNPKFVPDQENYDYYTNLCDDFIHNNGIELYEAQKAVAQAIVNNWKTNSNSLLVGECGCGKTVISSLAVFAHHANMRKGFNTIVMCPTHIVEKWKREVELTIPNSKGYIIHNLKELIQLKPKLLNKYRTENMFIIISKETAKFGYDKRPAAVWSKRHNAFVCPECGEVLYKIEKVNTGIGRKKQEVKVELTELDFLSMYSYNQECPHCKSKLWTALNRDEVEMKWIKIGKEGWILKDHIESLREQYIEKTKLTKKEKNLLNGLILQSNKLDDDGDYYNSYKGSKKYPIAKYIKNRMKNVFDYGIIDEAHELATKDSIQGQAFHYILKSCKKNVAMTGTLINGYADSIYYILYKMFPSLMKKSGFNYNDVGIFTDKYGVTSYEYGRTRKKKKLPGVSPLIFTEYLFNSTAFISLKDMKDELPEYTEIPIGIEMDQEIAAGYLEYERFMKEVFSEASRTKGKSLKIVGPLIKDMINYPDAPHCARPLMDPDTEELRFYPTVLDSNIRNKELELLNIVEQQVSKGEKVLIYYNAVHKTDIGKQLTELLESQEYKVYELKASVKSEKRESIIKNLIDEELNVLICNPSLVETGLDLIDFTTIIFYQVGYNLYTLRQASRRSWRLSQKDPVTVYYLYYNNTVQERALSLMATKLHAAKSMEGDFDEEGLKAMSENTDILTQIANNVVNGMSCAVDTSLFTSVNYVRNASNNIREHKIASEDIIIPLDDKGMRIIINEWDKMDVNKKLNNELIINPLKLFI